MRTWGLQFPKHVPSACAAHELMQQEPDRHQYQHKCWGECTPRWDGPAQNHSMLTAAPRWRSALPLPQPLFVGTPSLQISSRSAMQSQHSFLLYFCGFGIQVSALLGRVGLKQYAENSVLVQTGVLRKNAKQESETISNASKECTVQRGLKNETSCFLLEIQLPLSHSI